MERSSLTPREPEKDAPKADLEYVIQLQEWLVRDGLTYPAMLIQMDVNSV
jgi:manganese oxidase